MRPCPRRELATSSFLSFSLLNVVERRRSCSDDEAATRNRAWGTRVPHVNPRSSILFGFHPIPNAGAARTAASGAAAPQSAIAPGDERQAIFIARPARVLRQLEFLLGR